MRRRTMSTATETGLSRWTGQQKIGLVQLLYPGYLIERSPEKDAEFNNGQEWYSVTKNGVTCWYGLSAEKCQRFFGRGS